MTGIQICYDLADQVKFNKDYALSRKQLAKINIAELKEELNKDNLKTTFWINLYNAFSVILLKEKNKDLNSKLFRVQHFNKSSINIGGVMISLNNIEHQILRKDYSILSPLTSRDKKEFIKTFSVNELDPRIHFALNCGGMSCPPIRFYEVEKLEEQLNIAEHSFVETNTTYKEDDNVVETNELLKWYKFDFGGDSGLLDLFRKHKIFPEHINPRIVFSKYYWDNHFEFL